MCETGVGMAACDGTIFKQTFFKVPFIMVRIKKKKKKKFHLGKKKKRMECKLE